MDTETSNSPGPVDIFSAAKLGLKGWSGVAEVSWTVAEGWQRGGRGVAGAHVCSYVGAVSAPKCCYFVSYVNMMTDCFYKTQRKKKQDLSNSKSIQCFLIDWLIEARFRRKDLRETNYILEQEAATWAVVAGTSLWSCAGNRGWCQRLLLLWNLQTWGWLQEDAWARGRHWLNSHIPGRCFPSTEFSTFDSKWTHGPFIVQDSTERRHLSPRHMWCSGCWGIWCLYILVATFCWEENILKQNFFYSLHWFGFLM